MEKITFDSIPAAIGELFQRLDTIELLIKTAQSGDDEQSSDVLMTISQAGSFLNLTVPTIYGLVSRSSIPCSKKGKRLYFSKKELTEWIKSGRKLTNEEAASLAGKFIANKKD